MSATVPEHDLHLPAWGPYTKRYIGISHIADARRGLRFDLSIFPGFYRRKVDVPNVMWESGYHPWEAAPDLSYYSHRHELQWRDEVYCDIAFAHLSDSARLFRCECVNRTDAPQNLVLHQMASLHFPPLKPYSPEAIRLGTVQLPPGAVWLDARDHADLSFATPRPIDNLNPDGLRRGEVRDHGFVDGGGVGKGFGAEEGDTISYRFVTEQPIADPLLAMRLRLPRDLQAVFTLNLDGVEQELPPIIGFDGYDGFARENFGLGSSLAPGTHTLRLTAHGGPPIEFDGFVVVATADYHRVKFDDFTWQPRPEIVAGPHAQSLLLKYADLDHWYGLAWDFAPSEVREFHGFDLDNLLRATVHHHTRDQFYGTGTGHFTNVFFRPIVLEPGETRTIYGLLCTGDRRAVERQVSAYHAGAYDAAEVFAAAQARAVSFAATPAGEPYRFGQERMAATVLTNVVYPVYTRRRYIRHSTPGRWWDCLYTWDSGFIGLGLTELDHGRAIDNLRAYLTPPGDPDAAFIHHGSLVPTQHALCHELWNRTRSPDLLRDCYPGLRQYYLFLAGKLGSSTLGALRSGLLKGWDYFYNSGGWDDYPPQGHVHRHGLEGSIAPAITTAQAIRVAKILGQAADSLGLLDDCAEYDADIARFAAALQRHAWDDASGYFGYVRHDDAGWPLGILRHESGENFNRGLDGLYPLVAGICTPEQEERLITRLLSPAHHWTPIGLTTVDRTAPYYRADGYWNGAVWMAHQWYFWKTLLDLGRPDLARQIAQTALDLWRTEVERTYNCFEHFIVASGRGAGWHHFGGLSSPVLNWFGAYYRPGRLTTGLDAWINDLRLSADHTALTATLTFASTAHRRPSLIATLAPGHAYRVLWNGEGVEVVEPLPGVLEIRLPGGASGGRLVVDRQR